METSGRSLDRDRATRNPLARTVRPGLLTFAGYHYWTATLLPALVGTTLAFWLRPPGFSFGWAAAIEFLIATLVFQSGFSFLQARFEGRSTATWPCSRLTGAAVACIATGCLIGLHLNSGLTLHAGVPGYIFIAYGIATIFTGVLYVVPPFNFRHRVGGEVVLSVGLGLIPILGACIVQVGDITRRVYLAAMPLVVSTALWLWITELVDTIGGAKAGHNSLVMMFGRRFSGRYITPILVALIYATLILAVFVRSSLPMLSLIALVSFGLALRLVAISRNEYESATKMVKARGHAFWIHLITGTAIVASSLASLCR